MARSNEEYARIYHSKQRVAFVQRLACLACVARGPASELPDYGCENHHTRGGGTGRKGNFDVIVPLCLVHHHEYHLRGRDTMAAVWDLDWDVEARRVEESWQGHDDQASLFD